MYRDALANLSPEQLIELVLAQTAQIEAQSARIGELTRRVAELEAKLGQPPKTPDNSSLPPSQARKPSRAERRAAKKRKGRPGVSRALAPSPDRIVESVAERCPHCNHALAAADQPGFHAYDHIELPPLRPVITRIHRHRGVCPSCRRGFSAPAPPGMAPGSPFGPDLTALILHLHVTQAIGFERLVRLLDEVFGTRISEGAIADMLARAETPLTAAAETTAAEVRRSKVVASDETSARVEGKNWLQWVLLSSTAVHHLIANSRGAAVLTDFLGDTKPDVWVADRYAAQAGHGNERQLCLAHLLRDAQYAIDTGDTGFAPGFYKLLQRAVAIGHRRSDLKNTTLAQYRADLDRRLDRLLAVNPTTEAGHQLARWYSQMPRRSLCLRHPPRCPCHQQRMRASPAAQRDLPQSHRRVPLPMGRPDLRRRSLRHRHRPAARPFRSPSAPRCPRCRPILIPP
jgi:transposase